MSTLIGAFVGFTVGAAFGWYVTSRLRKPDWGLKLFQVETQMREAFFRDLDKATKELEGQDVMEFVNRFGFKWRRFMLEAYKVDRRLVAARYEFHVLMAEWDEKLSALQGRVDAIARRRTPG